MKNTILILSIIGFAIFPFQSRSQSYEDGHSYITVGYGFPNIFKSLIKNSSDNYNYTQHPQGSSSFTTKATGYGPILLKYEHALTSLIGVGASLGFSDTKLMGTFNYQDYNYDPNTGNYYLVSYSDITKERFSSLSIGARLNFHFGTKEKLDPYAGIAGGYTKMFYSFSYSSNNPNNQVGPTSSYEGFPVYFAITAGLRYYFTENIGAYAEIGFDKWSIMQAGLAIKF